MHVQDAQASEREVNSTTQSIKKDKYAWRALVAYWILGLSNNYGYVVMLSAAHDILQNLEHPDDGPASATNETIITNDSSTIRDCNEISTGAILLADIVPSLLTKLLAPFLPFFIHVRVASCVLLAAAGLLCVAYAETATLAILGVVVTSISSGLGEVSFLQYSSFFSKNVVSTWSSGTGGAGILGAVSYVFLSMLGLRTALLVMLVIPVTMAIAFWLLLPSPDPNNEQCLLERQKQDRKQGPEVPLTNEDRSGSRNEYMKMLLKKMKLVPGLMKFMIPLGSVYLFEYFINQGMFELIDFEGIFLKHPEQYHWLQVLYQVGVFVSRSSVNLVHFKNIWLMGVLQLVNVFIYTFEAIYAFIPTIWLVFILTLWEGLLGGAAYVNTFYKITQEVPEEQKQFSMSVTSLSDTIGITLAGILALPAHNAICGLPKPTRLTF